MKKTTQKITGIIALSASLVGHVSAFAAEHQADDKECPWHIGIKTWVEHKEKTMVGGISKRTRSEGAIGPFVEWKPFDGVGIQTGLIYGYNSLSREFNWSEKVVSGSSGAPKPSEKDKLTVLSSITHFAFHAISIPLSIWFYPGSDRQFALHGGLRLMIPLSKGKEGDCFSYSFNDNTNSVPSSSKEKSERKLTNDLEIKNHITFDFGIDYKFKSGFMIGINGLGLALGYDFTKLLIKA